MPCTHGEAFARQEILQIAVSAKTYASAANIQRLRRCQKDRQNNGLSRPSGGRCARAHTSRGRCCSAKLARGRPERHHFCASRGTVSRVLSSTSTHIKRNSPGTVPFYQNYTYFEPLGRVTQSIARTLSRSASPSSPPIRPVSSGILSRNSTLPTLHTTVFSVVVARSSYHLFSMM